MQAPAALMDRDRANDLPKMQVRALFIPQGRKARCMQSTAATAVICLVDVVFMPDSAEHKHLSGLLSTTPRLIYGHEPEPS